MARNLTPTYTDDASNVEAVTIRQTETDGKVTDEAPGASLSAAQHVQIVLTQGEHTYTVDTAQGSPLAAFMRKAGRKAGKRGRKATA